MASHVQSQMHITSHVKSHPCELGLRRKVKLVNMIGYLYVRVDSEYKLQTNKRSSFYFETNVNYFILGIPSFLISGTNHNNICIQRNLGNSFCNLT